MYKIRSEHAVIIITSYRAWAIHYVQLMVESGWLNITVEFNDRQTYDQHQLENLP